MPFTANRQFKDAPRMLVGAKGMYYTTDKGQEVLDGVSGMWCVNAGHGRDTITEAIRAQVGQMDYATAFQMGHPLAFELASRLTTMLPGDLNHVFFANSGSEAVDTALKIALAYHRARGEGTRTRFIGRERGYHGVGFGGTAVGGIVNNRKQFGNMLGGVDHLPHTHNLEKNAFSRGNS
jgi:beta-alanine--pyruvate transaminase